MSESNDSLAFMTYLMITIEREAIAPPPRNLYQ